jgi:formylglycine-generating enzyme required for sulfatase activity
LGKSPLEDPELYRRKSPFYRMDRVRTPTIIFFGTEDTNVPTQQGWMHYRALQQHGQAEARFVLFPGEEHGLKKLSHQRRKLEEELAWFDRYLFGTAKAENEAVKPGSLLAAALRLRHAAREGERYGRLAGGRLVPETVTHQGLEIGRFEVTRAQFAEFDAAYPVAPGMENLPANRIAFERARAYCQWLAQVSGEPFRLGTEQELAPVYAAPAAVENTLDYWAGYAVNPDDAQRLREAARELGDAPLLKPVGSLAGAGEDQLVFDLGGNVAEWVVDDQGAGVLLGGSADTAVDGQRGPRRPGPEYTGFRVVRGSPGKDRS